MVRALQDHEVGLPFHFFDNVDPNGMSRVLQSLGERLRTTLVITVSKSGEHRSLISAWNKPDTASKLQEAFGQGKQVVVTMAGSKL
jgi:glucose-6-phosphate isomerase